MLQPAPFRSWSALAPLLLCALAAAASAQEVFFQDDGDRPPTAAWQGATLSRCPGLDGQGLRLASPAEAGGGSALAIAALDAAKLAGRTVLLSAWVRGERISAKPKPYLGGKLMLTITRASGPVSYPAAEIETGSFDWTPCFAEIPIPADASAITLTIGLQEVTGTICFDRVTIEDSSPARLQELTAQALAQDRPPVATSGWTARLQVDPRPGAAVNPLVFGDNVEAWDSRHGGTTYSIPNGRYASGLWNPTANAPRPEVLALLRTAGVTALRYPGGTLVNSYDWKKTVGPPAERPDNLFGVAEYLDYCRLLASEPVITVADFVGTAQDAADLVEYVNAPADAAHPWAQRRAQDGHPQPWGVRYFELGNESYTHWTAARYGDYAVEYSRRMKAVDRTIHTGAVLEVKEEWTDVVLARTRDDVDFVIDHLYPAGIWADGQLAAQFSQRVMQAVVAASEDMDEYLGERRTRIRRITGRDLPLAITEYNGGQANQKPIPYRFTLGTALFAADLRRVLQKPEHHILLANYWQGVGGFWGFVQPEDGTALNAGTPTAWRRMPAYYMFRLWAQHCGSHQLAVRLEAPREDFAGFLGVAARGGDSGRPGLSPLTVFATRSADRGTIHLLVTNRHPLNDIQTTIAIDGLTPQGARVWVVTGPSLASWNQPGVEPAVQEVRSAEALAIVQGQVRLTFPARSLCALDLRLAR
jgi:alpha-L-arabinofuranosidase